MNKYITLSLLCASAYAQDFLAEAPKMDNRCCPPKPKECDKPVPNLCDPIQICQVYDNKGINLGVRADLLYMNYSVPIRTFASAVTLNPPNYISHIYDVKSGGSLGCDLALTYTLPMDPGYTFEGGWYHIVTTFKHDVSAPLLLPAHDVDANTSAPGTGKNYGALSINFFDLFMSKSYQFGSPFTIAPAVGIIGGYMDSHIKNQFNASSGSFSSYATSVTSITTDQIIKFEGIGIKLGSAYKFDIWEGLKIAGNIYYNALYGLSHSRGTSNQNEANTSGPYVNFGNSNASYTHHHGRTFVDSLVALAWQKSYWNNSMFFDIHVGWRVQAYPSGWSQFEAESNDSEHDLYLFGQGLDAGVVFKF